MKIVTKWVYDNQKMIFFVFICIGVFKILQDNLICFAWIQEM